MRVVTRNRARPGVGAIRLRRVVSRIVEVEETPGYRSSQQGKSEIELKS